MIRGKSDCTYVLADLVLNSSQNKYMVANCRKRGYPKRLVGYFRLVIFPNGCPSERRPRRRLVVRGDSARKLLTAPSGSLTCSVYSTITREHGLKSHPKDNQYLLGRPARETNPLEFLSRAL